MTYDDGPHTETAGLLDYLKSKGVKATFYINGLNFNCIYDFADIIQRMHDEGHQIASHTWSHPHIPTLTDAQIKAEMTKLDTALLKIVGVSPRFARLPYGDGIDNARVIKLIGEVGYTHVVQWDLDSGDSIGYTHQQSYDMYDGAGGQPRIALNHDVNSDSIKYVTPYGVNSALTQGYNMVTTGTCLGFTKEQWYKKIIPRSARDSTWVC